MAVVVVREGRTRRVLARAGSAAAGESAAVSEMVLRPLWLTADTLDSLPWSRCWPRSSGGHTLSLITYGAWKVGNCLSDHVTFKDVCCVSDDLSLGGIKPRNLEGHCLNHVQANLRGNCVFGHVARKPVSPHESEELCCLFSQLVRTQQFIVQLVSENRGRDAVGSSLHEVGSAVIIWRVKECTDSTVVVVYTREQSFTAEIKRLWKYYVI